MNTVVFEILFEGLKDTSMAPRGPDIYYRCTICGGVVPSQPKVSVACGCGNIVIDLEYFRLAVEKQRKFQATKLVRPPRKASR